MISLDIWALQVQSPVLHCFMFCLYRENRSISVKYDTCWQRMNQLTPVKLLYIRVPSFTARFSLLLELSHHLKYGGRKCIAYIYIIYMLLLYFANKNHSKQLQHCFASLSNMRVIRSWMNQLFKWFGSVATTHLLSQRYLLVILISHLKYLHFFFIISNISFQHFMFQISKHYFCICNCRLNAFLSCIEQCVNTSIYLFRCSFCVSSPL